MLNFTDTLFCELSTVFRIIKLCDSKNICTVLSLLSAQSTDVNNFSWALNIEMLKNSAKYRYLL